MSFDNNFTNRINKIKWIIPSCFVFACVVMVAAVALLVFHGFEAFESTWTFSVGADVFGIAVSLMLLFGCLSARKTGGYTRVFVTLIVLIMVALFLDECAWLVQNNAALATWNLIVNVFYYANSAVLIFFFWRYASEALNLEGNFLRFINDLMMVLCFTNVVACFVNFFYPLFFSIDASGVYVRSQSWISSQIYLGFAIVAIVLALILSKANLKTKLVTGSFVSIPLVHQLLTQYTFGITTQYAAMLVSVVLIYCVTFADREKMLATTGRELALATRIQADMLPNIYPAFPERDEFDVYATMTPAREVGGDFYDFFLVDDNHLAVVIADVSGKGIPAALFMMVSKILVQNFAMMGKSPKEVLETVNAQICKNNREEMFVTVWLGILDIETGKLTAANAGHEYPVFKKADGSFELVKDKHGFVIGGMDGAKYKEYEIQMQPDSKLFLYTDGVAEATNSDNQLFGTGRMLEALKKAENQSPEKVVESVREDINAFVGEAPQFDDITMLCLHYVGKKNKPEKLTVEATTANIDVVTDFVNSRLEKLDCPMKAQMQIDVAIDEIFANIANYAYEDGGTATVEFEVDEANRTVKLTFIDSGTPFDPLERQDPDVTLPAEEREVGGLGVFLVKKTMDETHYEHKDGCNVLTIVKKI